MSDEEEQINPKSHKNLLHAISSLGKTQHIRKSTRGEASRQQDEFQLVKSAAAVTYAEESQRGNPIAINDIVRVLKSTKKHVDTGKQLKNVQSTKKVLERPLEKPAAERLKRTIGYENVKNKLKRWDAVVAKNRSAETQIFPLPAETIYVNTTAQAKPLQLSLKSELMQQMEAAEAKLRELKMERAGNTDNEQDLEQKQAALLNQQLTRDEIVARRKELAYLKMRESQKNAKARQQNKIKSKKYHKLLRRQKLQAQMKEFELLQKTNPEAALEKLNELEKSRVLERATLRHKNTSTWAKNLQIRAKYDKDVRKDLAEQLQLSRQLTQKQQGDNNSDAAESDAEANYVEYDVSADPFNPWTRAATKEKRTVDETAEMENWRKYWLDRNQNEKLLEEYKAEVAMEVEHKNSNTDDKDDKEKIQLLEDELKEDVEIKNVVKSKIPVDKLKKTAKNAIKDRTAKKAKSTKVHHSTKNPVFENGWFVEELPKDINIDDIFDEQEDEIRSRLDKQLQIISKQSMELNSARKKNKSLPKSKKKKDELNNLKNLTFKEEKQRPVLDEELNHDELDQSNEKTTIIETALKIVEAANTNGRSNLDNKANSKVLKTAKSLPESDIIDPNQLAPIKLKQSFNAMSHINASIGDDVTFAEDEDNADDVDEVLSAEQQMTISQAFEDDDIVADFSKEKTKDAELKNAEIELSMPGWGSWAGAGITHKPSKNKRLVLKLAKEEKRRDENKGGLYINEEASKQLRSHLVSQVPFPFTSLQDYEASIRAPVGRNFVTETSFRMLTRPAVITRKGQVIEPMDESELIKPPRKLRNTVDKRIESMNALLTAAK